MYIGDIKTAYLNGDQTELERQIWAEPPEEVKQYLNMKPHELWRVAKAVYGLCHAPRKWFEKLQSVLWSQGWQSHQLDQCVFLMTNPDTQEICGYLGAHVDDLIVAGAGPYFDQQVQKLRQSFPFGSWDCAQDKNIKFCGCDIFQTAEYDILVNQESFPLAIDEINLTRERKLQKHDTVTLAEKSEMRRALGALNWRAVQTCPWLLSTVSHLQGCVESATVNDLLETNKAIRWQRRHSHVKLSFPHQVQDCMVLTFCDASWATRRDGSSQGGSITILMNKEVLSGKLCHFSVLTWTSRRLRRIARSSTSAEVQMTGNGLDEHEFVKLFMYMMMNSGKIDLRNADPILAKEESCILSDAKNVYDALERVQTCGLQMEERRSSIEALGIKERLNQTNVKCRWVSGDQELADGLTKPWKGEQLIQALNQTTWRIMFDPTFVPGKKRKQLKQVEAKYGDPDWMNLVCNLDESHFGQENFWTGVNLNVYVDRKRIHGVWARDVP